jgi:hypothetical protein
MWGVLALRKKRYTANTPVSREVDRLFEYFGGRLVLEAVADYTYQRLDLNCFAPGFAAAAERLPKGELYELRKSEAGKRKGRKVA